MNLPECRNDGGDCDWFNMNYPDCEVPDPEKINNGKCDRNYTCTHNNNIITGSYNSKVCGWDGGDCLLEQYPNCHVRVPGMIGDGKCDGGEYNKAECDYDGGDCKSFNQMFGENCTVKDPWSIGNEECDRGENDVESCNYDGGDCGPPNKED